MTERCLRTASLVILASLMLTAQVVWAGEPTYAERLGWPEGTRVVLFHVDDAGMSHDSNVGAIEAVENGVARSMSIMFPCPWATEIVKYVKAHPEVDAGVHLTLTSEYQDYRWGPLSGAKQTPSLVDQDGYLWRTVPEAAKSATADEVDKEIRAQLDRCRAMDIEPTHLDSHMGTLFANPFFLQRYIRLGVENQIPVMMPAGHMDCLTAKTPVVAALLRMVGKHLGKQLWDAGLPVLDDLHLGYLSDAPEKRKGQVIAFLRSVKPGVTQYIVHCTRPTDVFPFISESGPRRLSELEAMIDPDVRKVVEDEKIVLTTWRELKQRREAVEKREQVPVSPGP